MPRCHLWHLGSGVKSHEVPLDDHFDALLSRLSGSTNRIRELVQDEATARIQVVRHFDPGPEDRHISEPGRYVGDYERVPGQHPLVGFGLEPDFIRFSAKAGIGFDFDEYGYEHE